MLFSGVMLKKLYPGSTALVIRSCKKAAVLNSFPTFDYSGWCFHLPFSMVSCPKHHEFKKFFTLFHDIPLLLVLCLSRPFFFQFFSWCSSNSIFPALSFVLLVVLRGQVVGHLLHDVGGLAGLDGVVIDAQNKSWKKKKKNVRNGSTVL